MKLLHITARHPKKLVILDLYYKSLKAAMKANPFLTNFEVRGVINGKFIK